MSETQRITLAMEYKRLSALADKERSKQFPNSRVMDSYENSMAKIERRFQDADADIDMYLTNT